MTTPLISITLPTFLVLPLSAMGLLKRVDRGAPERCAQAPAQRGESSRPPADVVSVPLAEAVVLQRVRHTGGVAEISAVGRDRRGENCHYDSVVAAGCRFVTCRCGGRAGARCRAGP